MGGRGSRQIRRPCLIAGSVRPCTLPRRLKALLSQV